MGEIEIIEAGWGGGGYLFVDIVCHSLEEFRKLPGRVLYDGKEYSKYSFGAGSNLGETARYLTEKQYITPIEGESKLKLQVRVDKPGGYEWVPIDCAILA